MTEEVTKNHCLLLGGALMSEETGLKTDHCQGVKETES